MKNIVLALVFLLVVFAQEQEFTAEDIGGINVADLSQQGQQPSMEQLQRYRGMKRTACLVLSRHHANAHKDEVGGIIQGLDVKDQQAFIDKMYSVAVEICEKNIAQQEVQKMYTENNNFDASEFFPIFSTVDYTAISKENFKLTPNQEGIVKYIKQFDEEMAVKREEEEAEQERESPENKFDIKVFGVSAKDFGATTQVIYFVVFGSIVGGLLYYGFRELNKAEQTKDKKKKSQKNSKSPSPQKKTA